MWLLHSRHVIALWSSTNNINYWQRSTCLEHTSVVKSMQPLVSRAKTFPSLTVQYVRDGLNCSDYAATWFRSISGDSWLKLSHCLAGSFSFSVSVLLLVNSSIPRITAASWTWNPWLQLRMRVSEGHLMMTSMKPNHSNHIATVCKDVKVPPTQDVADYNPSWRCFTLYIYIYIYIYDLIGIIGTLPCKFELLVTLDCAIYGDLNGVNDVAIRRSVSKLHVYAAMLVPLTKHCFGLDVFIFCNDWSTLLQCATRNIVNSDDRARWWHTHRQPDSVLKHFLSLYNDYTCFLTEKTSIYGCT